jgi:hypothetical protein
MSEPLDELYFRWLYDEVAVSSFDDRDLTYWKVLRILFRTEFRWSIVRNDENRAKDGIALRFEFLHQNGTDADDVDPEWLNTGCSMFELMVGLSRRLRDQAYNGGTHYWFWQLMENLGLRGYSDERRFTRAVTYRIESILDDVIKRNYESSGLGGLFPLQHTRYNQRKRELWYQMSEYILEHELAAG